MATRLDHLAAQQAARERVERTRENAARLAKSYLPWHTTGWGEFVDENVLDFGLTFTERPSFTFGYAIDPVGPDLVDGRFPRGFAFVYDWRIVHPHGDGGIELYTGAWCAFVVETVGYQFTGGVIPTAGDPQYQLQWSLQFEGVAYKDLPMDLLENVETSTGTTGA